jgi:hypothetical protein
MGETGIGNPMNALGGVVPLLMPTLNIALRNPGSGEKALIDVRSSIDSFTEHTQKLKRKGWILKRNLHTQFSLSCKLTNSPSK